MGARNDDMTHLKMKVTSWLMKLTPPPSPVIHRKSKIGCRLNNDATGSLICPVNYDWNGLM